LWRATARIVPATGIGALNPANMFSRGGKRANPVRPLQNGPYSKVPLAEQALKKRYFPTVSGMQLLPFCGIFRAYLEKV